MSYETFTDGSTVGFRATGETRETTYVEAVRAFSATVGAVGAGTARHTVTVSGSSPEALLVALLESLLELQAEAGAVVAGADALEIFDDDGYRLVARVAVDADSSASVLNPGSVDRVDATAEAGGPWRLEAVFRRPDSGE